MLYYTTNYICNGTRRAYVRMSAIKQLRNVFLETKLWENSVYRKTVCSRDTASRETWKKRGTDKEARDRRVELFFGVIQAIRQEDCEQSYVGDKIRRVS